MYKYKTNVPRQHKKYKQKEQGMKPAVCGRQFGKVCKTCTKVQALYNTEDDADKKIAGKTRAKSTFYMNIIDLDDRDEGVQVYGCGIENWKTMVDFLPEDGDDGDGVDFTDPDDARAVIIKRRGKGLGTNYTLKLGTKPIKIKKEWLASLPQLHDIVDLIEDEEVTLWKPSEGRNRIIVLPPWGKEADGDFYFEVLYHWNMELLGLVGEDEDEDEDPDDDGVEDPDDEDDDDVPY